MGLLFDHPVAAVFVIAAVSFGVGVLALEWETIAARWAR